MSCVRVRTVYGRPAVIQLQVYALETRSDGEYGNGLFVVGNSPIRSASAQFDGVRTCERAHWSMDRQEFVPSRHSDQRQYKRVIIPGMETGVTNANGRSEAHRAQVPLILAWVSGVKPKFAR